jgi:hypothetical protein
MSPPPSGGENEEPRTSGRGNFAAIIAVIVLVILGYWAFNYLDQQRKLQNCLDSGRRDCGQAVNPAP